jgi:abortive infection bacteriophage resistance protein
MANIATSIESQIKKLHERGMILDLDSEKTSEVLLDIGYYRLGFIGILLNWMINTILKRVQNFRMY